MNWEDEERPKVLKRGLQELGESVVRWQSMFNELSEKIEELSGKGTLKVRINTVDDTILNALYNGEE